MGVYAVTERMLTDAEKLAERLAALAVRMTLDDAHWVAGCGILRSAKRLGLYLLAASATAFVVGYRRAGRRGSRKANGPSSPPRDPRAVLEERRVLQTTAIRVCLNGCARLGETQAGTLTTNSPDRLTRDRRA
jgi:hypothetical protein